ncbi:MAG: hypothetical protein CMM16_03335 [Rhodospirillaceae bacterium]|nr:hypothetical protein [Rhodospirillaceae bacterium]
MPNTLFQDIRENNYGKPILDRIISFDMSIERAATASLLLVRLDMGSSLSPGLLIGLTIVIL